MCREAATDHSPGLFSPGTGPKKIRPERRQIVETRRAMRTVSFFRKSIFQLKVFLGRPFSANSIRNVFPRPWAMIYSRFAPITSHRSRPPPQRAHSLGQTWVSDQSCSKLTSSIRSGFMQSLNYLDDTDSVPSFCDGFRFVADSPVKHILAPTDLTARSRESVACAVRLARGFNANLTLLHVTAGSERADLPFSPLYAGQLELDARRVLEESQKAERTLRAMRDRIRVQHALTEDCFLLGDPGAVTLWVAREFHVDLMVISTWQYNWLDCLFDERGDDKIIRDAPCSILVVPGPQKERLAPEPDNSPLNAKRVRTS